MNKRKLSRIASLIIFLTIIIFITACGSSQSVSSDEEVGPQSSGEKYQNLVLAGLLSAKPPVRTERGF